MKESFSLAVTSLFLLLTIGVQFQYLWRKYRCTSGYIPLSPFYFLLLSVIFAGSAAVFVAFLGLSKALLAGALAFGVVVSLMHPVAAVSFFVALLLTRPWEQMGQNAIMGVVPKLFAVLCLISWGFHRWRQGGIRFRWDLTSTIYVCFVIWLFLAALFSGTPYDGMTFVFDTFFPITVICFLLLNSATEPLDLTLLSATFSIAVTTIITTAIYGTITSPLFAAGLRLQGDGLLGNANDLAAVSALVLPFMIVPLLTRDVGRAARIAGLVAVAVQLWGVWLSQSRGAMASLGLCLVVYMLVCGSGGGRAFVKRVVVTSLLLIVPALLFSEIRRDENELAESSESRWNYAVTGFKMVKTHPIFGVGVNNYPKFYPVYTSLFIETGERTAHSSWVLVMAEAGFIGLFLFVGLFVSAVKSAWALRKIRPEFFLGLVSYGIAITFLSHTYMLVPYLLMGFVLSAAYVLRGGSKAEVSV